MPSTVTTEEHFDENVETSALDREVELRIKAGAVRSWYEDNGTGWTLFTEWNVIGEQ